MFNNSEYKYEIENENIQKDNNNMLTECIIEAFEQMDTYKQKQLIGILKTKTIIKESIVKIEKSRNDEKIRKEAEHKETLYDFGFDECKW